MLVAQLTNNGFDILNVAETNTSIVREQNVVRLSDDRGLSRLLKKNRPKPLDEFETRSHRSTAVDGT